MAPLQCPNLLVLRHPRSCGRGRHCRVFPEICLHKFCPSSGHAHDLACQQLL